MLILTNERGKGVHLVRFGTFSQDYMCVFVIFAIVFVLEVEGNNT